MKEHAQSWGAAACLILAVSAAAVAGTEGEESAQNVLDPAIVARHATWLNAGDVDQRELLVPNTAAAAWLEANVPLFECSDPEVEEIYYYRFWALRKHLRREGERFVVTEFLTKERPLSSALGHHLMEMRWLRDPRLAEDYVLYWLRGADDGPQPFLHSYSSWLAHALYHHYLVTGDEAFLVARLDELVRDYEQWEKERRLPSGLFWQYDVRDAMEESISGSRTERNVRPTIMSYMFGNARAIAEIARLARRGALADEYERKAAELRRLTLAYLWNAEAEFFEVRGEDGRWSEAREAIGFMPWYFGLPAAAPRCEAAWKQLTDPAGFRALYGITTAERRHPRFRSHGIGTCEWDGAVWPFATSQTLVALANLLRDDPAQPYVSAQDYFSAFLTYVRSQRLEGRPYVGEYLDETTGQWIMGDKPRSRDYNHSTFADLLITGVIGLRPRADETVEIQPLLPENTWRWFCLDAVRYHGHRLTILWDRDGDRYGKGSGLRLFVDGHELAHAPRLQGLTATLPTQPGLSSP